MESFCSPDWLQWQARAVSPICQSTYELTSSLTSPVRHALPCRLQRTQANQWQGCVLQMCLPRGQLHSCTKEEHQAALPAAKSQWQRGALLGEGSCPRGTGGGPGAPQPSSLLPLLWPGSKPARIYYDWLLAHSSSKGFSYWKYRCVFLVFLETCM